MTLKQWLLFLSLPGWRATWPTGSSTCMVSCHLRETQTHPHPEKNWYKNPHSALMCLILCHLFETVSSPSCYEATVLCVFALIYIPSCTRNCKCTANAPEKCMYSISNRYFRNPQHPHSCFHFLKMRSLWRGVKGRSWPVRNDTVTELQEVNFQWKLQRNLTEVIWLQMKPVLVDSTVFSPCRFLSVYFLFNQWEVWHLRQYLFKIYHELLCFFVINGVMQQMACKNYRTGAPITCKAATYFKTLL